MGAVKLQSESEMAARFSTKEILDIVTADNDFGLSDNESSEEEGEGVYAYLGESRFGSVDVESFRKVALSTLEERDRRTATLCSEASSSDDREEREQLMGKPNMYSRVDVGY